MGIIYWQLYFSCFQVGLFLRIKSNLPKDPTAENRVDTSLDPKPFFFPKDNII
jgi:hypothetical protein